jgi:hypothetical protein
VLSVEVDLYNLRVKLDAPVGSAKSTFTEYCEVPRAIVKVGFGILKVKVSEIERDS